MEKSARDIRRRIEVVITSRTRNAVVGFPAHGFESHRLRTKQKQGQMTLLFCPVRRRRDSNPQGSSLGNVKRLAAAYAAISPDVPRKPPRCIRHRRRFSGFPHRLNQNNPSFLPGTETMGFEPPRLQHQKLFDRLYRVRYNFFDEVQINERQI